MVSIHGHHHYILAELVYDRICQKLIFRHPHIFGDAKDAASSTEEGWAAIKRLEKGQQTLAEEVNGIAKTLPALTRAEKIAGKLGAEGKNLTQAAEKFDENPSAENLGALLFEAASMAKKHKIDPEEALTRENQRKIAEIC